MRATILGIDKLHLLLLLISILLGAFGQVGLKIAASQLVMTTLVDFLTKNIFLFGAIGLYAMSLICYIFALQKIPLVIAFPSVSLSYLLVMLLSQHFLHESLHYRQFFGTILIVIGVCSLWT